MKSFKKVLALVLAGVLALAMLTACDGTPTRIRLSRISILLTWLTL